MNIFLLGGGDHHYLPWLVCVGTVERVTERQELTVCPEYFVTVYCIVLVSYNRGRKVAGLEKFSPPVK
jgi:hypothetical protein